MNENELWVDEEACRTLADGLGTAGQELQVLGKGGAIVEVLTTGLPAAKTPDAYQQAARAADKSAAAVGTSMVEMSGTLVGAIASYRAQEGANARRIEAAGEGAR